MAELEPAALTERVLRLGRAPPLSQMTTDELALLAAAGREVLYTRRTLLVPAEERAMALYVPLTGRLRTLRDGQPVPCDAIREFYGGTSLLSGSVIAADVVAEPGTALFILDRDALLAVLEEHGAFARSLLRNMSRRVIELRGSEIVKSGTRAEVERRGVPSSDLLSRMRLLRDGLGLGARSLPVLAQLAHAAHVRRTGSESVVWETSANPADVVAVIQGAIDVLQNGHVASRVLAGEGVGMAEAVAAIPVAHAGRAVEETVTVEVSCAELEEAIEDHDDFCQDLIRVMALELHQRSFGDLVVSHA